MRASEIDRQRLEKEVQNLVNQMVDLGAIKVILFGSLARGEISLFSDIDLLVLFEDQRSSRELGLWLYKQITTKESVDILAYNEKSFNRIKKRSFIKHILTEGQVLYERPKG